MIAFDRSLRDKIKNNIDRLITPALLDVPGLRRSAVAVIVTRGPDGAAAFLLTVRASRPGRHAGQFALPGGRIENGETPDEAARRETAEEIGLLLSEDALLGRLDDYETRSGFAIAPLVYWSENVAPLKPDPGEVAEIRHVALSSLNTPGSPVFLDGDTPGRPILRLYLGEQMIHAPTAAVLYQFRDAALLGQYTSVAHFDQPDFARR